MFCTLQVCGKTSQLLAGFADGCIRLVELHAGTKKGSFALSLVYVQKPHTAPITAMKQSPSGEWAHVGTRGHRVGTWGTRGHRVG